jgi:cytochrome c biogenesis protein CcmG/thiol:disulfide interchange protein DsbE
MAVDTERHRAGTVFRAISLLLVVGFIALLTYGLLAQAPDTTIDEALSKARAVPAPGFELAVLADGDPGEELEGAWRTAAADGRVDLSELRGTPVVLNFWASWCDPCQEEAPVLRRGADRWREQGVLFLGLDMQDVREDAREFLREFELDFPQVRDPTNATARRWGVTGIPETFFISARGEVVGHVIGSLTAEQLDAGARAAQKGQPLSATRGGEQRSTR